MRRIEYLLVGVLGVIIVGCIWFALSYLSGDEQAGGRGAANRLLHFECKACGYQFTRKLEEVRDEQMGGAETEEGMLQLDCPHCGKKKTCLQMVRCPKCKEYYLLESTKRRAAGLPQDPSKRDICPHCGQDRRKFYEEKYGRKK